MKAFAIISAAAILAGCATTTPVQSYRPANYAGAAWNISGSLDEVSNKLTVTINGQKAVEGALSMWDSSGELSGKYEGRNVAASCRSSGTVSRYYSNYKRECIIFVDNERAATLVF